MPGVNASGQLDKLSPVKFGAWVSLEKMTHTPEDRLKDLAQLIHESDLDASGDRRKIFYQVARLLGQPELSETQRHVMGSILLKSQVQDACETYVDLAHHLQTQLTDERQSRDQLQSFLMSDRHDVTDFSVRPETPRPDHRLYPNNLHFIEWRTSDKKDAYCLYVGYPNVPKRTPVEKRSLQRMAWEQVLASILNGERVSLAEKNGEIRLASGSHLDQPFDALSESLPVDEGTYKYGPGKAYAINPFRISVVPLPKGFPRAQYTLRLCRD